MFTACREISEQSEERVAAPAPCPICDGHGLDRQCAGHAIGPGVLLYCGCSTCGGDDLTVTLSHFDRAALAA